VRRISEARLAGLVRGWEKLPGRKAERLSSAIRDLLVAQEVPYGCILPSERSLAEFLGVSRTTVAEAYSLLRESGVLESRRGSGSRLRRPGPLVPALDATPDEDGRLDSYSERALELLDFSSGALPGLPIVAREWAAVDAEVIARLTEQDGYLPAGMPELREGIARIYEQQGVPTSADEILVTSGSQQALEALSRAWIDPGESIIVEDPSYRGALETFRNREARILTIPMEADGPDVDALERITRSHTPRFVYLLPTCHNPTGITTSAAKRDAIRRLSVDRGVVIVEDTSPADLVLGVREPPPPLLRGSDPALSIGIGSLSKLFWGGLRVGWIRGPRSVIATFRRSKSSMDLGSSIVSQLLATRLLSHVDEARALRRAHLEEGLRTLEHELAVHLPEWTWPAPAGGSGLWVRAPGVEAVDLVERARQHGVSIVAGPTFSAVGGYRDHVRLPFFRVAEIPAAVARLEVAWRSMLE
jgi:DNA-binding transcriptional MocR family regulator